MLLLLSIAVHATADDLPAAKTAFQEGLAAFKSGLYPQALHYFQSAASLGFSDSRLYYNLGMAHYKLHEYEQAENALRNATSDSDLAAMAYINMGLAAWRQNEPERAKAYWRQAGSVARNDKERRLQALLLEKARTREKHWDALLRWQAGYNDNVLLQQEDAESVTKKDVGFTTVYAWTQYRLNARHQIDIAGYGLKNAKIDTHDYSYVNAGYQYRLDHLGLRLDYNAAWLSGRSFIASESIGVDVTFAQSRIKPYAFLQSFNQAGKTYDYLEGTLLRAGLESRWHIAAYRWTVQLQWETNNRADVKDRGKVIQDVSPSRYQLQTQLQRRIGASYAEVTMGYRESRYEHADQIGITKLKREDKRGYVQTNYYYPIVKSWWLQGMLFGLDNQSRIELYRYQTWQAGFGVMWRGG